MNQDNKHIVAMELLTRVLANEATEQEKLLVNDWLDASEENRKEFAALEKLWNFTGNEALGETIDIDAEWKQIDRRISPRGQVLQLRRFIQIAASIIVIFGLSYLGYMQWNYTSVESDLARIENIKLPDGSTISLNAHSKIRYARSFGKKSRKIKLSGEAYFDVASNKEVPFVIAAGEASIRVVGTQFNVKAYKGEPEVSVSVLEGKVDFFKTAEPTKVVRIVAGQSASFEKVKDEIQKKESFDKNEISWKTLKISFLDERLEEVVEVLENTYHYQFELSEKVKDCTITVDFEDQNLNAILKVLKSTLNLSMKQEGRTIIISGDGCVK